ncbi:MAG TPA: hypothetical protein V6C97_37105 [Oculatellaceae cyanobacterium]
MLRIKNKRDSWAFVSETKVTAISLALSSLLLSGVPLASLAAPAAVSDSNQASTSSSPDAGNRKTLGLSDNERQVKVTPKDNSINHSTAKALNRIPGVKVEPKDLEPPPEQLEIKGFHPIKKLLAPIVRLERNSVQLQQQIMKLEGPIAGLNPPMMGLQKRMTSVEGKMGNMQEKLDGMNETVTGVGTQMNGVRSDIQAMRKQISALQEPIMELKPPIEKLQGPLVNVAEPLSNVRKELAEMKTLLATVLAAILIATIAISIGTPIAAIYVYRNRKKIFPGLSDHELQPHTAREDRQLSSVR